MSTRGALGFRIDETDKIMYNHFDSYPSGLGADTFDFILKHTNQELKQIATEIELIDENEKPTNEQIEHCYGVGAVNLGVSNQSESDWYCLLREAQGNLTYFTKGLRYMSDNHEFMVDSLFCEYAYIINCDINHLEFYSGFNRNEFQSGRYSHLNKDGYSGVVLLGTLELTTIRNMSRTSFIQVLEYLECLWRCCPKSGYSTGEEPSLEEPPLLRLVKSIPPEFTRNV
jgi:hypothetical protein